MGPETAPYGFEIVPDSECPLQEVVTQEETGALNSLIGKLVWYAFDDTEHGWFVRHIRGTTLDHRDLKRIPRANCGCAVYFVHLSAYAAMVSTTGGAGRSKQHILFYFVLKASGVLQVCILWRHESNVSCVPVVYLELNTEF